MGRALYGRDDRPTVPQARHVRNRVTRLFAQAGLFDVEGTVGSIAFVQETLFPYARSRIEAFVRARREDPPMRALLDAAAREAGANVHDFHAIVAALLRWSDDDVKVTPLKELQGMIWQEGFESGELRADLYPDAVEALRRFARGGVRLFVYSSGSIAAQQLLFGYSTAGDLRPLFDGFFDTTTGPKREAESYARIAAQIGLGPPQVVFFSDHVAELDAARAARMQTVQLARPQDGVEAAGTHPSTQTFNGITIGLEAPNS